MPNWCANRIEITAPLSLQGDIEAWISGTLFPFHKRAIQQSLRMFIAGVAGRLKPAVEVDYPAYPELVSNGSEESLAGRAFSEWIEMLKADIPLSEENCETIDRCYRACGLEELKWESLTLTEKTRVEGMIRAKSHDWGGYYMRGGSPEDIFNGLCEEPEGDTLDLRMLLPTRLAAEINGFNGKLLEGVSSTFHFYSFQYGTKWPAANRYEIWAGEGILQIDTDTAWAPPEESVMEALSARWNCTVKHWYSEAGCDFCGYREYEAGAMVELIDDSLWYAEEDEDGYSDVIGPEWLVNNITHFGG